MAKETRPEAAGMVSIIASRLPKGTINDILLMNKMANHLRSTAQRCLTNWKFDINALSFVVGSDAGGVGPLPDEVDDDHLPSDGTQGAWMVLAAERIPKGTEKVRVSPLSWRSSKLKRRVPSTLAGEALAMSQGVFSSGMASDLDARCFVWRYHWRLAKECDSVLSYASQW